MTISAGMARVARVTGVAYALAALVVVGSTAKISWDHRSRELKAVDWTLPISGDRQVIVSAANEYEASEAANAYQRAHPSPVFDPSKMSDAELQAGASGEHGPWEDYAKVQPVRIAIPNYPRSMLSVLKDGGVAVIWCGAIYLALWAVFRALRWVALGFMEKAT